MRAVVCVLVVGGCYVGYPPVEQGEGSDSAAELDLPRCASVSMEPDDGTADDRISALGLVDEEPRSLCGDLSKASNDGVNYTGDVDYLEFQTLDAGKVHVELTWDGSTQVDLQGNNGASDPWRAGKNGVLELKVDAGFHTLLVAGVKGPPCDYRLTATLR